MKNLKKIVLGLMLLLAAFAFVGCPTPEQPAPTPDPEPTPVAPVNNFKGNVYVKSYEMYGVSQITGYIEFTDDTNGQIVSVVYDYNEEKEILEETPFTYTVKDDVATFTQGEESITTSKLANDKFTVSEGPYSVICTKGDKSLFVKGSVFYGEEKLGEDLYLVTYVNELVTYSVSEDEYSIKDGNIYLTEKGYDKVFGIWTFDEETFEGFYEIYAVILSYGLEEGTDYTINWETLTVTLTEAGAEKIASDVWGLVYGEEEIDGGVPKNVMITQLEMYGLVEGDDYTIDSEKKAFILTDSGMLKIEAMMGGSEEEWIFVGPDGNELDLSFSSLEEALDYASFAELVADEDYTIDEENQVIILTDSSFEKVSQWM